MANGKSLNRESLEALKLQLKDKGQLAIKLMTGSMAPVMKTGTLATLEPCRFEDLKPLDFIVFLEGDILICHAIWGFGQLPAPNGDRTVVTRGLMNPFADDPVRESLILGRVVSHRISKFGFILTSLVAALRPKPNQSLK